MSNVVQRRHSYSNAGHCQGWCSLPRLPHVRSGCSLPASPLSPVGVATHHCFSFALCLTCCAAILWVQPLLPDVSGLNYLNDGLSSDKLPSPSNLSLSNFCLWLESASSSKLHDWHFNPMAASRTRFSAIEYRVGQIDSFVPAPTNLLNRHQHLIEIHLQCLKPAKLIDVLTLGLRNVLLDFQRPLSKRLLQVMCKLITLG